MLSSFRRSGRPGLGLAPLFGLALVLAACGGGGKLQAPALADTSLRPNAQAPIVVPIDKPIVIGVSVPLTGPDASAGEEDRDAVIATVNRWKERNGDTINGHQIVVHAEDDGCTEADITVQAAERLLRTEGLVGVIGPNCSAGAQAAIPVYADAGLVAISGSATRTDLTTIRNNPPFFFRTAYRNDLEGTLIGLFTSFTIQARSVWLIDDAEPYGEDLAASAAALMLENGVMVTRRTVRRGTVDFSQLASEIAHEKADLVGFAGFNPEAALFYRQLRDAGYQGPFGSGDAAASLPDFVQPVGADAAEGVLFAGCSLTLPADVLADFTRLHGRAPEASAFVAQYADAATVLLDAVAQTAQRQPDGSLSIDPMRLRNAVAGTDLQDGISGSVAFDKNGDRVPRQGDDLERLVADATGAQDISIYAELGLVPCQVQDGRLVNLLGPGAGQIR